MIPTGRVHNHPELRPAISAVVATVLRHFPHLVITSTTGGQHAPGSFHYQGRAADLASGDPVYMMLATWFVRNQLRHYLVEGIHNPHLSVKWGNFVPSSFWGPVTWDAHKNHIHLAA